jgi:hypothetical protein
VDGSPEAYVSFSHVSGGDYNAAWDIWFNRTDPANPYLLGQNSGTEIMIWLVNHTFFHPWATVRIEGRTWQFMSWIATNRHNGTQWHYIAFIAPQDISQSCLRNRGAPSPDGRARKTGRPAAPQGTTGIPAKTSDVEVQLTDCDVARPRRAGKATLRSHVEV